MKRIICIILALVTLVTFLIVPAAATENDSAAPYQPYFQDILALSSSFSYTAKYSAGVTINYTVNEPSAELNPGAFSQIQFTWGDQVNKISYDYIYINIKANSQPSSVLFNNTNVSGTLISHVDDYYFYRFNISGTFSANFTFTFNLNYYNGYFSIVSAYAVDDFSSSIDEVDFVVRGQFVSDGQYYTNTIIDQTTDFPYTWRKDYDTDSPVSSPERIFWYIVFDMPVPYADSVSFTFSSSNTIDGPYEETSFTDSTGVQFFDSSGTEMILPYTVSSIPSYATISGHQSYIHTVTVDTTGVDFNNSGKLCFRFYMWKIYTNYDHTTNRSHFYHVELLSLSYQNTIYTKPWYLRFFYWIQQEFTDLISSLSGFFTNLQKFFTTKFNSLEATIKKALGVGQVAPDISDQQQGIQNSAGDMDSASDEIGSSREELDELMPSMPSWEDTGLDGFDDIVGAFIQEIRTIFLAIYANSIINQILAYTFLFALGGFILFGER